MASLFRSTLVHIADPVIEKNRPSPKRASLLRLGRGFKPMFLLVVALAERYTPVENDPVVEQHVVARWRSS